MGGTRRSSRATTVANSTSDKPKKPRAPVSDRIAKMKADLVRLQAEEAASHAKETNPALAKAIISFEKAAPFLSSELAERCREELRRLSNPEPIATDDDLPPATESFLDSVAE
jgi:hypothetical protein